MEYQIHPRACDMLRVIRYCASDHLRSMDQNFVRVRTIGKDVQQIRLRYEVVARKLPPSPVQEIGETFFAEVQLLLDGL